MSLWIQKDKKPASLRQQLASVISTLDNLRAKKDERIKIFSDLRSQIEKISEEIREYESQQDNTTNSIVVDEYDLSTRKLDECHAQLCALQKDKVLHSYHEQSRENFVHMCFCSLITSLFPNSIAVLLCSSHTSQMRLMHV